MAFASYDWEPFVLSYQNDLHKTMPAIGLGTHCIKDRGSLFSLVDTALRVGYRSFDTAAAYRNEEYLGEALRTYLPRYDLLRDDVYITTKLSNANHCSTQRVHGAFELSVKRLGFEPDLYLIHFPGAAKLNSKDSQNKMYRHKAWKGMVEIYDTGAVSAIGVSNFTVKHLEDLATEFHSDVPAINQVEYHPLYHDEELHEYCNKNSIVLQGYSPLGGAKSSTILLTHPTVVAIANNHCVKPAQVLLTWSLQKGVGVIPKSSNLHHIEENIDLRFRLTHEEVHKLDMLSRKPHKFSWVQPTHMF